uniref:Chemokine interleukin-8-like domain-containing protein n=1 Tax=Haplochromis burtoni TaxID=8153 RepID=A0A3Q2WEW1_HAPBU
MANSGSLCALVAVVLLAVVECGSSAEKLATCCTKVTTTEIKEPITGYLVQTANPPCVQAVIFQTQSGLFCAYLKASWVRAKIVAFKPTNTVSMHYIDTDTSQSALKS